MSDLFERKMAQFGMADIFPVGRSGVEVVFPDGSRVYFPGVMWQDTPRAPQSGRGSAKRR